MARGRLRPRAGPVPKGRRPRGAGGSLAGARPRGGRVRALCYERHGDPRDGVVKKIFDPRPGPGEIVVRVVAAALNPVDWKIVEGRFPFLVFPKRPFVP